MCFRQIANQINAGPRPSRRGILEPYAGPNGAMIGSVADSKNGPAMLPSLKTDKPFLQVFGARLMDRAIENRFAGPNAVAPDGKAQGANIAGVKPSSGLGSSFMSQGYLPALARSAATATGRVVT